MRASLLIFASVFAAASTFAEDLPDYCKVGQNQADEIIPADQVDGNYWLNTMGADAVLFTAGGGHGAKRFQAFDLKGHVPVKLFQSSGSLFGSDAIDPTPAPDGRHVFVHPNPLRFYDFDKIRKAHEGNDEHPDESPLKIENNPNQRGYYESMGVIESKGAPENYSIYRVLTGQGQGTINDYRVDFDEGGHPTKVSNVSPKVVALCRGENGRGLSLDLETPMISPKGDEFAALDRKTGTTVLIKFDPLTGKCEKSGDLGFSTGKVHFSPDGRKIAFHTSNALLNGPRREKPNRPYLFDRDTGEIKSLSVGDEEIERPTAAFPAFLPDGRVIYQRIMVLKNGRQSRSFVIVDPKKINAMPKVYQQNSAPVQCDTPDQSPTSALAIADLWKQLCPNIDRNLEYRKLSIDLALLGKDRCEAMIKANWESKRDSVIQDLIKTEKKDRRTPVWKAEDFERLKSSLDTATLLAACPGLNPPTERPNYATNGSTQPYPAVIRDRCVICHVAGSPHGEIPWDKPETLRTMAAIGNSASGTGPYSGKTFVEQLEDILKNNIRRDPPRGSGIPRVPADGPRLGPDEAKAILDWVKTGTQARE